LSSFFYLTNLAINCNFVYMLVEVLNQNHRVLLLSGF